jgi:uncharacterized membrane protein YfcA
MLIYDRVSPGKSWRATIPGWTKGTPALEWLVHFAWLIPLGLAVGAYGTLIGAGGGFILVPILLLLYPHEEPEILASISLAVVFFNTASGSWAYARMGRIDYRAAAVFALATVPGAVLGAITTGVVPRRLFDAFLGALMLMLAPYIGLHPTSEARSTATSNGAEEQATTDGGNRKPGRGYQYSVGAALSLGVGYISSLLGIGGGIVHVPALVRILKFPVHTATATSHLIVATMALAGTIVHISTGSFHHGVHRTVALSIGVVLGAQVGAVLSNRLHGAWVMRGLAIGLLVLGLRLLHISVSY